MAANSVLAFWLVTLLLVIVPGADWAFTINASLRGGSVVVAVSGIALGYVGMTVVVAAGLGALVAESPAALTGLTIAGGCYLVWLGARTLARPSTPPAPLTATAAHGAPAGRTVLIAGAGVSGLNPKGLLVFLAVLPQFTNRHWSWPVAGQIGVLGIVFTLSCAAVYLCVGVFARTILQTRPAAARTVSRFSGAAMITIGILLLAERLAA